MEAKKEFGNLLDIFFKSMRIKNSVIRRKSGSNLILVSSIGYNDNEPKGISKIREGMSGLCAEKNIIVTINDLELYHDKYFIGLDYIKSAVSMPLTVNDVVVGTINFASEYKDNFDKKKIEMLKDFVEIYKEILMVNYIKNHESAA